MEVKGSKQQKEFSAQVNKIHGRQLGINGSVRETFMWMEQGSGRAAQVAICLGGRETQG